MNVHNPKLSGFSQSKLRALRLLADQAAIAIENARLFEKEQAQYRRLQESQAQLIQAEKLGALGRLVASIAHEINNPLQSVQGCLTLTQEELAGSQRREKLDRYLNIVDNEIERVVTIVRHMRNFYRPAQQERQPTDLIAVMQSVLALGNKQLQHNDITVVCNWDEHLPVIQANPAHLKQVFLNLLLNAMDAMSEGGTLRVSIALDQIHDPDDQQPRPAIHIKFADTGSGMSSETVSRLFEPFFTTKETGTGLGLSISYGIIKSHGGQITVTSEVNRGTTFTILLPIESR